MILPQTITLTRLQQTLPGAMVFLFADAAVVRSQSNARSPQRHTQPEEVILQSRPRGVE